uniref:Putative secreted protein n=1 Tax=Ixodes ricinus TaxID=34613 RepID=A0A6B0UIV5_IXORI
MRASGRCSSARGPFASLLAPGVPYAVARPRGTEAAPLFPSPDAPASPIPRPRSWTGGCGLSPRPSWPASLPPACGPVPPGPPPAPAASGARSSGPPPLASVPPSRPRAA